ncbi:hypothetical protein NBRC116493_31620 [Aurantivibrio infirmus]
MFPSLKKNTYLSITSRYFKVFSTYFSVGLFLFSLSSCATTSKVWKPYDRLTFHASARLNPDGNDKPSPIQLKVYELSSRTTFDNQDFDGLFNNGETLLSDELLSSKILILQPKETLEHQIDLKNKTSFVAVLAAYRNIDTARWKHIYAVKPYGHYKHDISLGPNAIIDGKVIEKQEDQNSALTPEKIPDEVPNHTGNPRKRGLIQ